MTKLPTLDSTLKNNRVKILKKKKEKNLLSKEILIFTTKESTKTIKLKIENSNNNLFYHYNESIPDSLTNFTN